MDLPIGQPAKAEESIKLELCKRPLVVLDNVDMSPRWLDDFLCRYATGVRMSRRRLYTDSEQVHFTQGRAYSHQPDTEISPRRCGTTDSANPV